MDRKERKRLKQLKDKCLILTHKGTGKFLGFHNDGDFHVKPYPHYDVDVYELMGGTEAERQEYRTLYNKWLNEENAKATEALGRVIVKAIYGQDPYIVEEVSSSH